MQSKLKIIVVGGSGLVGSHILAAAQKAGHEVWGTYRSSPAENLVELDGQNASAFGHLLEQHRPHAVVHAAGFTWVDGCEDDPERAREENAIQPEQMAGQCHALGIRFAYVSTSYVFDGKAGPYTETDAPNPINVYSHSKWEGEKRVQAACKGQALIPRIICVYGAESRRKNFAFQVWRALEEGRKMRLPADQCGNPTFAGDIARWLVALLERKAAGVWNLAGPEPDCTRIQWAERLVAELKANGVRASDDFLVEAVSSAALQQKALRPLKAGMITSKLASLEMPPTPFADSIRELVLSANSGAARFRDPIQHA